MTRLRAALLVALIAGVAFAVALLSGPGNGGAEPPGDGGGDGDAPTEETGPRTRPFQAAADCRPCHEALYAEWEGSYHGMAWTDPMVQALSNGFRMSECIDCHAPQPIHVTGVESRVAPRNHAREEGVDCLTCHLLADGVSVAAVRAVDTTAVAGACRPVETPVMARSEACASCHNQHQTVDELQESGLDKVCQDCHMEPVERTTPRGARPGRSHVFPGAHSLEMHRRATELAVRVKDGEVVVTVTNVGAGHRIPTDARHRSYNVWLSAWDARGNPLVKDHPLAEYRLYYRDQFLPSTQIPHGESRESRWRVPEGVRGRVVVRLTYALNPEELALGKVLEVAREEVEIE